MGWWQLCSKSTIVSTRTAAYNKNCCSKYHVFPLKLLQKRNNIILSVFYTIWTYKDNLSDKPNACLSSLALKVTYVTQRISQKKTKHYTPKTRSNYVRIYKCIHWFWDCCHRKVHLVYTCYYIELILWLITCCIGP